MKTIIITTEKQKEVIDITGRIEEILIKQEGVGEGVCHIFLAHTTAALATADLDPGTDLDMLDAFERIIPKLGYRHPHNPEHTPDHILSSLIGASLSIPFKEGKLILGTWQRVVLIEFDGPRERTVIVNLISSNS